MKKNLVLHICKGAMLCSLAVILGVFVHFNFLGGTIFLAGSLIFLFPVFLNFYFSILCSIISVVLIDVLSGYSQYFWISAVAYGGAVAIIALLQKLKLGFFYLLGAFWGCAFAIFTYFSLEWVVFDKALALSHVLSNTVQFVVVFGTLLFSYYPAKLLAKTG